MQRIVSKAEAEAGEGGRSGLGENGEAGGRSAPARISRGSGFLASRYTDARLDQELEAPVAENSLEDYIKVKKPKKKGKGAKAVEEPSQATEATGAEDVKQVVVSCPVCGEFEGDEAAVAHHVEMHFGE